MADTKTTYPDGNAGYPSDGTKGNQGGKQGTQSTDGQTIPANPNATENPNDKKGNFR